MKNKNNVEFIDSLETLEFSYKALAPNDSNNEEYVGYSKVVSEQVPNGFTSTNTIVTLDKIIEIVTNPDTDVSMLYIAHTNIGIPVNYLFFVIVVISFMIVVLTKKVKKDLE